MNLTIPGAWRVGILAAIALAAAGLLVSASSVLAQGPYTAYGIDLDEGDVVVASLAVGSSGTGDCASTVANEDGEWVIEIFANAPCSPQDGDIINFTLNGELATETATWCTGCTPANDGYDADIGIPLTISPTVPPPAGTGNAGLLSSNAGTGITLLLLAALSASLVVGSRILSRDH